MLKRAYLWLRSVVLRRRLEREMKEEMSEHLERSKARLMSRGVSAEEAHRQALREFGNVTYVQEEARDARGTRWLDELVADARFAVRQFVRRPLTTLVMFVVLAVGMSISTLLFSYVHTYAVRPPLEVPLEDDLVRIRGSVDAGSYGRSPRPFSEQEFKAYRALTKQFRAVAGWTRGMVPVDAGTEADRRGLPADVTFTTDNYFSVLDVRPILGRGFTGLNPDDPGAATVAVLGHRAWQQLFGGSPDVIGSAVVANGVTVMIVGVAPAGFIGMHGPGDLQLWMPLAARRLLLPDPEAEFRAVARLQPGVSREAATAAVRVVAGGVTAAEAEARPAGSVAEPARDPSAEVVPLLSANGDPNFYRDVRLMALSVGLLGLLVLLVACTNVSALLTGVAASRRHEIAIRLSLGAARMRVLRQLLTESVLLATAAATAALGVVWLVLTAVRHFLPAIPMDLAVSGPAILFTFAVALLVGILFGLSPALHANRLALASASRDSAGTIVATRARLQRGLVVAQIALTQPLIVLLTAVLVFMVTNYGIGGPRPHADQILTLTLRPPESVGVGARPGEEAGRQLRDALRRLAVRLDGTPGVVSTAIDWGITPPLTTYSVHPDDRALEGAPQTVNVHGERAAEGYFGTLGFPIVRGRDFGPDDAGELGPQTIEAPVILGAELSRTLWGNADPIGRRLRPASDSAALPATLRVVGIVDDPSSDLRNPDAEHTIYLPPDTTRATGTLYVRTADAAAGLAQTVRAIAQSEAPTMVARVRTIAEIEAQHQRNYRIITGGILSAGLAALFLSAIGLYAVVAFSVGQRLREIAVRIAIGARHGQIIRRFLGDGLKLSALGLVIGLPLSIIGLHALDSQIGEISVSLPAVTAIAALGVLIVATTAVWLPARRAATVDPAVTLRGE